MLDLNHQGPTARLSLLIDKALEARIETPRTYLGASRLGEECGRALQFEFFGTPKDKEFSGQTLRTFAFGNAIEKLMAEWLRSAGVIITGRQAGFKTANGLIQGHVDGVINGGPADFGPFPRLWEMKTASSKKFKEFEKHHVQKANKVYYVQIQIYMAYLNLQNPALFTVMNKDTSELYFEDVPFDPEVAQEASDRGARIVQACQCGEILPRISEDPGFYLCSWCAWTERCHAGL